MIGDLIKEIEAGGPVSSFPKAVRNPRMLEKGKGAVDQHLEESDEPKEKQATEPQNDWVKEKWALFYEPDKDGVLKPQLDKMNLVQFERYMRDVIAQGRYRPRPRHLGNHERQSR